MDIASFCIKHKVTTVLAFIVVTIFGLVFYSNLKLALMPNMEFPAAYVMCTYPGANPEDVEELVTRPLESCVATVTGVEEITSTSSENVSIVMITYEDGTDVDQAAVKLREKFGALSLPDGCQDPVIMNFNINDLMPVAVVSLAGDDLGALQTTAEDSIIPALERIDGVASATVNGGLDTQITVETNAAALAGYGLSISSISNYLAAANVLYPGGDVQNGTAKLTVTTDGKFQTVEDVRDAIIFLPQGGSVRLGEIATVYLDGEVQDATARVRDEACVVLTVNKQSGANEVETAHKIQDALANLAKDDATLQYELVYDASEYIQQTISSAMQNILMGVALSAIVVFLFLRRPGATITISLSMPICVIAVILVMNLFDITMNMISMGAIAICVGMVVDNSIVVLENIYRYAGDGYGRTESCVLGTKEVVLPITASTLTTVAVFLPVGLSGGMAGMVFKDFALTVVFLILISLVVAVTLVPLMCYFLLDETKVRLQKLTVSENETKIQAKLARLSARYMKALDYLIHHRTKAFLLSVAAVVLFLLSCLTTDMVLMPDTDQGTVNIAVSTPSGTELEQTAAYSDRIVSIAQEECPEIETLYAINQAESATIMLDVGPKADRDRSSKQIANDLREALRDIAGCDITVSDYSMMMGGGMSGSSDDISVAITGADQDMLETIAADLTAQIAALPDAIDVKSSLDDTIPAVKVAVRQSAASQYGLTSATIGGAVRAELTGVTATTVTIDGSELDVVIRGSGASAESLDALRSMPLATPTGGSVPLSAVADVSVELSPQSIARSNQSREVTITGSTISGSATEISRQIQELLDGYDMPEGYSAEIGGTYSQMMENFGKLGLALLVAIGLVYFILASQFESFLMPVIVMMILPLSLSGALFGLPITRQDISMIVLLGLIMLTGTVVNSSIILVDYINVRRAAGQDRESAILAACPLRVRPIMMTTMTTVLALIPMALGIGSEGSEIMQPLGIVMIFGMLISVLVTLLFTPVFYSILDSFAERVGRPFRTKQAKKKEKLLAQLAALEAEQAAAPHQD